MRPEIQSLNLDFTTHCDRRCRECCCGIGMHRILQHHSWEYFERAAETFCGIPRVNLVGGEPTYHPQFAEYVPELKRLFGCTRLTMTTNGWGIKKHRETILDNFDAVEFTDYHIPERTEFFRSSLIPYLAEWSVFDAGVDGANHISRTRRGSGKPCTRAWWRGQGVAYADGLIYCCCAAGIAGSIGIEPKPGWDERMPELPCKECWFSE